MKKIKFLILTILMALAIPAFAEVPRVINYQGRLTDADGVAINGSKPVTFRIYDVETAGNALWAEDHTIIAQKGVFSVLLGSVTPLDINFDKQYYIEIVVDGVELSPRMAIASSAYSLNSDRTTVLNESDMISNSEILPASQNSIKEYIKNNTGYDYIKVSDTKPQQTYGGASTAGVWNTRDITTEDFDTGNNCAIASNQIILEPGTYEFDISAPALMASRHQARFYDKTNNTVVAYGTSEYADVGNGDQSRSFINGMVTISTATTFEIQHYIEVAKTTNGLGHNVKVANEVYTVAIFRKVK